MKKNFLYTALGLMGIMGALSMGVASATDTSCWSTYSGTEPTPYVSGIVYGCDNETNPGNPIPIITIYGENENGSGVGITIKAMNEGTGKVKIGSRYDTGAFGSHYQWGNNYPFPLEGNVLTGTNQVDAGAYGPRTALGYYNDGSMFRTQSPWDTSKNKNLWGGSGDQKQSYSSSSDLFFGFNRSIFEVTNSGDRRGMCDTGYHIPSAGEWRALMYLYMQNRGTPVSFEGSSIPDNYINNTLANNVSNDFQIPFAGSRTSWPRGTVRFTGSQAEYWSSSPSSSEDRYAYGLSINPTFPSFTSRSNQTRNEGNSIRCFRNSYVKSAPSTFTLTFVGSGQGSISTGSIEAEEGAYISRDDGVGTVTISGTVVATGIANEGYVFSGWLTDCGATVTASCSFTGEFKPITYSVEFTGIDVSGTMSDQEFTYDQAQDLTANAFTKTGYTFSGWTYGTTGYADKQNVSNLTATDGATVTLTAQWTANIHKLSFVVDGTTIQSGDVAYAVAISAPAEPKKDCNSFAGWTSSVEGLTTTGTMPDSDVTFTANWNYTCSRSSGGGGGGSSRNTEKTTETQTGSKVDSSTKATDNEDNTQDSSAKASEGQNQQQYSEEFQQAYEFAYKHGITTMPTIEQANMEGPLTRIAMAKMLSYYAINVLGLKPDETRVNKFNDVSDQMDAEYNNAVSLAYQLGIMGINMPKNRFRPNDLVTRAEFATALSRMLYKIADGKDKYYSTHLAKLMEEKIITNDNPNLQELRGYVMIMLMRSAK